MIKRCNLWRLFIYVVCLLRNRAVFSWGSKVIGICFDFALQCQAIGLKNSRHFVIKTRSKTKTNRDSNAHVFQRFLSATCICFEFWVLTSSSDCMCPLWLAKTALTMCSKLAKLSLSLKKSIVGYPFKISGFHLLVSKRLTQSSTCILLPSVPPVQSQHDDFALLGYLILTKFREY